MRAGRTKGRELQEGAKEAEGFAQPIRVQIFGQREIVFIKGHHEDHAVYLLWMSREGKKRRGGRPWHRGLASISFSRCAAPPRR